MKALYFTFLVFLCFSCNKEAPSNLMLLDADIPTDTPLVFGKGIISTNNYEFAITFSPEMNELFFTRRKPEEDNKIYTMQLVDGKWSNPEPAFFAATEGWDFEPHINPKGDKLYFGSTRPLNDTLNLDCTNGIVRKNQRVGVHQYPWKNHL